MLKEEIGDRLNERAAKEGIEDFVSMIADEEVATTEEEVVEYMQEVGHPALEMEPMM